jgi:hypothetical protein
VIGDWGILTKSGLDKGYFPVLPCMNKTLGSNKNIQIMLFTGDLAYDLQGDLYSAMLKHI